MNRLLFSTLLLCLLAALTADVSAQSSAVPGSADYVPRLSDRQIQNAIKLQDKQTGNLTALMAFSPLKLYRGFLSGKTAAGAYIFVARNCDLTIPQLRVPSYSPDRFSHLLELPCDINSLGTVQTLINSANPPPLFVSASSSLTTRINEPFQAQLELLNTTSATCDGAQIRKDQAPDMFVLTVPALSLSTGENTIKCRLVNENFQGEKATRIELTVVGEENLPPEFLSSNAVEIDEGTAGPFFSASAVDPEGDPLTFGLAPGRDAGQFAIDPASGELRFISAPAFSAPADTNADNVYEVGLTVTDSGGETDELLLAVTVMALLPPSVNAGVDQIVAELSSVTLFGQAVDDRGIAALNWLQTSGTPVTLIGANTLAPSFTAPMISGTSEVLVFLLTATDTDGASASDTVTIEVQAEGGGSPVGDVIDEDANSNEVSTGAAIGTPVGITAVAEDPDASDTVTYTLSDDAGGTFSINNTSGVVVTAAAVDALIQSSYSITVRASSTDGTESSGIFTISVLGVSNTPPIISLLFPPVAGLYNDSTLNVRGTFTDDDNDNVNITIDDGTVTSGTDGAITSGTEGTAASTTFGNIADGKWDGGSFTPLQTNNKFTLSITGQDATTGAPTNSIIATLQAREFAGGSRLIGLDVTNYRIFTLTWSDHLITYDLILDNYSISLLLEGSADLAGGEDMLWDPVGNRLLVVDSTLDGVYQLDPLTGVSSEISGDTVGTGPIFSSPEAMALNPSGNLLYVVDGGGVNGLFVVDMFTGDRTIISDALNGTGVVFSAPRGLALDDAGNRVFVSDSTADAIFEVDLATGNRTIISDAVTGIGAALTFPTELTYDPIRDQLFLAQSGAVIQIDATTGNRTLVKDYDYEGRFEAYTLEYSADDDRVYVAEDSFGISGVSTLTPDTGIYTPVFSTTVGSGPGMLDAFDVIPDLANNRLILIDGFCTIFEMDLTTGHRSVITSAGSECIVYGVLSADGTSIYGVDFSGTGVGVWEVDLATGAKTQISGDASGSGPAFDFPGKPELNATGDGLYIANENIDAIYFVDLATGARSIVSSNSDVGTGPNFFGVQSVVYDPVGDRLLVMDRSAPGIYEVEIATGNRTIFSAFDVDGISRGTGPDFDSLQDGTLDADDNRLVVTSQDGFVMGVDLTTGDRTYLSGRGVGRGIDIEWPAGLPFGIGIDPENDIAWVADFNYDAIYTIDLNNGDRIISAF